MKTIKKLSLLTLMVFAVAGVSALAHATAITVDQIIYKIDTPTDTAGLTAAQAANLSATVDMTFSGGVLTVILTNTSGATGETNASNALTGLGFNLPTGVTVVDNPANNQDSTINISDVGSTLGGGTGKTSPTFNQDKWGYATGIPLDHFKETDVLTTNIVLTTNQSDASKTFSGANATATNMDQTDYGLISSTGSDTQLAYITPSIKFSIYLSNVTDPGNLLAFIQDNGVVVAYGSARPQGQITVAKVPEPMTLILYGFGFAGAGLYRRLRRRRSVSGLHS